MRLQSLNNKQIETRTPSQEAVRAMSEFARKTGDYAQLSGVDLQVLALLYDLEVEAANLYNNGNIGHVRREPKRVLGVSVKALNGDGKLKRRDRGDSVATSSSSVATSNNATSVEGGASFFQGNADGIIDASNVDLEYDDDDEQTHNGDESVANVSVANTASSQPSKPKAWATLVNPTEASTAPLLNYSLADVAKKTADKEATVDLDDLGVVNEHEVSEGQFDDASEDEDSFSDNDDSDEELKAINIANAESDEEMSDEECDVFILEPHEAAYYKKLKEQKLMQEKEAIANQLEQQNLNDDGGLDCEFPSLSAAAAVPYEGSDDEMDGTPPPVSEEKEMSDLEWQKKEEERKKKALQPMVNGRFEAKKSYNSFRKYTNVVSAGGSSNAVKKVQQPAKEEENPASDAASAPASTQPDDRQGYKSRIIGAAGASSANDFPSEMTADDDDGEGWVTCTRDIQNMKAAGSIHLNSSRNGIPFKPKKDLGPPISQRAACATTDFAMQNVILQMNLELLSVDGVRVRRLKTWVTRCAACFTVYGGNDQKGKQGTRLFCDKCGSNTLQRISASVDRNSGRLKLHMKKNYQHNTRGTKFALPKAGKGNKYQGDLLLAEDQLMYGAWGQKVRKGKSKASSQSIFGSDLASDLGCHTDLTKRDDIKVGFGRRNPNSTKFGRERRGKKKKNTTDKACGLRRY